MICFSVNQSKFLLKTYYQKDECDSVLSITNDQFYNCNLQLLLTDSIVMQKNLELTKLESTYNDTKQLYAQEVYSQQMIINKQQRKIKLFGTISCILVGTTVIALIL